MRAEHNEANGEEEEAAGDGEAEEYASDIDLCDFDVENVDDLFDMAESPKKEKRKRGSTAPKADSKPVNNGKGMKAAQEKSKAKPRYDSTSSQQSDRIWEEKFMQDSQVALFQIDSLVVVNDTHLQPATSTGLAVPNTRAGAKQQAKLQAKSAEGAGSFNNSAATSVSTSSASTSSSRSRKKAATNKTASKAPPASNSRPRMIHTEKAKVTRGASGDSSGSAAKKSRSKTYISRTETSNLSLDKSRSSASNMVDDYEIISPATHPPNQISSSPLHIKQEQEQQQRVQLMYRDLADCINGNHLQQHLAGSIMKPSFAFKTRILHISP